MTLHLVVNGSNLAISGPVAEIVLELLAKSEDVQKILENRRGKLTIDYAPGDVEIRLGEMRL